MRTSDENARLLTRILRAPLAKWPEMITALDLIDRDTLSHYGESDIERLTMLSAYMWLRNGTDDHKTALKYARAKTIKVRRALGYAYPKQGLAQVNW